MRPLLILTKNVLVEQDLQQQLQTLNYEVFCSSSLLEHLLLQGEELIKRLQDYQAIFLTDSIGNAEVTALAGLLKQDSNMLLRVVSKTPTKQELSDWQSLGIDACVSRHCSLEELREQLVTVLKNLKNEHWSVLSSYRSPSSGHLLRQFLGNLSTLERGAFDVLVQSEGEMISRQALCQSVWNGPVNNSRLSQISILIRRLKEKLVRYGFDDHQLETVWGGGYRLNEGLRALYEQETTPTG